MEINEFQYPDGWYMRVGQIYSSPYESYHVRITRIEEMNEEEQIIYYVKLNPRNYKESYNNGELDEWAEDHAYAWWFNEGVWDLEKEPDNLWVRFENGSSIEGIKLKDDSSTRGSQSQYYFGIDESK